MVSNYSIFKVAMITHFSFSLWYFSVSYAGGLYPLGSKFPVRIGEEINNPFFLSIDIILSHMITLHPPYESQEDCSIFVQAISHSGTMIDFKTLNSKLLFVIVKWWGFVWPNYFSFKHLFKLMNFVTEQFKISGWFHTYNLLWSGWFLYSDFISCFIF